MVELALVLFVKNGNHAYHPEYANLYNRNTFSKVFSGFFKRKGKGNVFYTGLSLKEEIKKERNKEI
jgi:hypothetical protein